MIDIGHVHTQRYFEYVFQQGVTNIDFNVEEFINNECRTVSLLNYMAYPIFNKILVFYADSLYN